MPPGMALLGLLPSLLVWPLVWPPLSWYVPWVVLMVCAWLAEYVLSFYGFSICIWLESAAWCGACV